MAREYFSMACWNRPALNSTLPSSFCLAACLVVSTVDVDGVGGSEPSTTIGSAWLIGSVSVNVVECHSTDERPTRVLMRRLYRSPHYRWQ